MAVVGKEVQRHSSVEQSEKWQGHSIVRFSKARSGKGIARKDTAEQGEGIAGHSMAMAMRRMGMKRDAEEKQGKQCIAEQSEGIAKKRRARQGQSIEKLCFARAEDTYKGAGERAEQ